MFNDTDNGQTQYCPMCEEWAEKYDQLKVENEELKKLNDVSIAHRICINDDLQQAEQKLEQIMDVCCGKSDKLYPLKEIMDIINEVV